MIKIDLYDIFYYKYKMPPIQMESEIDYSLLINVVCILIAFGFIIVQYVIFTSHVEIIQSDLEDHIFALRERVDALEVELYGEEEEAEQSSNLLTVNDKED